MVQRIVLCFIFVFAITNVGKAQSKYKSRRQQTDTSLVRVYEVLEMDPVKAIELIREKLADPVNKHHSDFQLRAYTLLGDIYVQIGQNDLATSRYDQALEFISSEDYGTKKRVLFKQGSAFLPYDMEKANLSFQQCSAIGGDDYVSYQCEEGLAEVLFVQGSLNKALEKYMALEKNYEEKGYLSDVIRIQSKTAELFAMQNDLEQAQVNFQKAYSNANITPIKKSKDKQAYESAKEELIRQEGNVSNEIMVRGQNVELKKSDPVYQAVERLKLAEAYVKGNQPILALNTLKIAERSVRDIKAPEIKAEINKKLSEAYVQQGDLEGAMKALDRFEDERQLVLDEKESELNRQIAIVKGQQAIDLDEKDYINQSSRIAYERNLLNVQKYIIGLLSLLLLIATTSIYFILKNVREKKRANKLLELKGLRAQMNPHFLFNALNTVNEYIAVQDERKANQYLTDFSALMRLVLENSQKDLIPLEEEIEASKRYLELEHRRFETKFDYTIEVDEDISKEIMVPPLLFQPYIENAIWHGLRYKEEKGHLYFKINTKNGRVEIIIEDDGIGRKRSQELKTKNQKLYQSTGLKNTGKRMELINEVFDQQIELNISDREHDSGTIVQVLI